MSASALILQFGLVTSIIYIWVTILCQEIEKPIKKSKELVL